MYMSREISSAFLNRDDTIKSLILKFFNCQSYAEENTYSTLRNYILKAHKNDK